MLGPPARLPTSSNFTATRFTSRNERRNKKYHEVVGAVRVQSKCIGQVEYYSRFLPASPRRLVASPSPTKARPCSLPQCTNPPLHQSHKLLLSKRKAAAEPNRLFRWTASYHSFKHILSRISKQSIPLLGLFSLAISHTLVVAHRGLLQGHR